MQSKIVVWDPEQQAQGMIIEGANLQRKEVRESLGVLLPVDSDLLTISALTGYFRRDWGDAVFGDVPGKRRCPMVLYAYRDRRIVHWCARLKCVSRTAPRGTIRLVSNTTEPGAMGGALEMIGEPVDLSKLGATDRLGGWTIYGRSRVALVNDGYLGLSLYGWATGVAVDFTAVTQTAREE